jgi:hypothetical protein
MVNDHSVCMGIDLPDRAKIAQIGDKLQAD